MTYCSNCLFSRIKYDSFRFIGVVRDYSQLANPGSFTRISNTIHKLSINDEVLIVNQVKNQARISLDEITQ